MAADLAYPYDITLTISGGTTMGFMLSTPKGQSKQISFKEAGGPEADRMNTKDIATSRDFDPRVDTPMAMSNFTGGVGQLEYDFNDENSYWWSNGVMTGINGKIFPAPPASTLTLTGTTGAVTCFRTYMTNAFVRYDFLVEGMNIWRRPTTDKTTAWTKVYTDSVAITDFRIMDGVGIICVPSLTGTTDFKYQSDVTAAATWVPTSVNHTPFSDANGKPKFGIQIRGTFYALVKNNQVYYTTDPTVDGWAGPITTSLSGNISGPPGDDSYPFVGANAVSDFLFCRRNDAIYSIDASQDVLEAIWQWKEKPSQYHFNYACAGGDNYVFNVGTEIYVYDPQTGQTTSTNFATKDGYSVKEILGLDADEQFLYILAKVRVPLIRSADSVAVFRGRRTGRGLWTFEVLWEDTSISGKTYGVLAAMPGSNNITRLYWGQDNASDTVTYVMDIPAEVDASLSSSFTTSASLWTSISRSGFPGFYKKHLFFNMNTQNLDANNTIAVNYSTNLGSSFSALGTATSSPLESNFSNVSGLSIVFRFDFTSAGTVAPTLNNFDHHQRVRFKYLPSATVSVRLASSIEVRNRGLSNVTVQELWENIVSLRTSNSEIAYKDFLGNAFNVSVDMIGVQPTRHDNPQEYEQEALLVITRADRGA